MDDLTEPVVMGALEASLVGGAAIAETGGQASRRAAHRWGRKHSFEGAARKEEEEEAGLQERHRSFSRPEDAAVEEPAVHTLVAAILTKIPLREAL
jgi:hypothetical protein